MTAIILVGVALLGAVLTVRVGQTAAIRNAGGINTYFADAVRVFSLTGDEAAHSAALSAGKTAADEQRTSMIGYLRSVASDLAQAAGADGEARTVMERIAEVADKLAEKNWTMSDIVAEKRRLKMLDAEYFHALGRADSGVFRRRYPMFFS
jgi:hypothetical protein